MKNSLVDVENWNDGASFSWVEEYTPMLRMNLRKQFELWLSYQILECCLINDNRIK